MAPIIAEVAIHQVKRKNIVPGRNGGVGGEDGALSNQVTRFSMTVSGGDEFPDAFYGQEGRMAFIAMPDRGIDAQGAQDPHAADPEQKLLTEPDFLVSTVEPRGEGAIFGRVRCV